MAQESRLSIVIDSRSAKTQVDQLRTGLMGLDRAGGQATDSVSSVGSAARAAGNALAALGVGAVTREVLRLTDSFKSMQGSLALVSTSTTNANESFQKLLAMANNTGSSLESTVSLYTRLANATRGAGYTQEQMLNVTDALNKAFVISGATMQEASNAAIQLSQGLASGTLRGEELNSVMEQGPRITRALADYLGVTNGEIRKLAAEGKITGDVVTNALLKSLTSLNAELAKMPRTFEQASQALKNNFLAAIGQINVDPVVSSVDALASSLAKPEVVMGIQNIANALGSLVAVGGDGLKTVAENTDALMAITGAYATRVGTGLVVSLAAATKARYADLVATQQQVVAEKQAEVASTAAAAQATRKAVADETAAVAATQRSLAETAAARAAQANTIAQLQAVQQQLAADRALETQRLQAQINDVGRQQSLTRLGEIRRAEAAITLQQAAAERALSQAAGQEIIIQGQLAAGQARLTTLREADTVAVAAQNAAQVSLNTSQSLGARASAGLMALAGGPIGLVTTALTLAAGAAIYFASSTDSATQSLIDQNLTLDDSISKFKQLSAEQQRFQSAKWMEAQRDAAKDASSALNDYFTRAFDGLNSLGASGVESADTFKRVFEEVRNGQRSLDSLTGWLTSSTQLSNVYRDELVKLGAEYSASSQKADDYARLLDRSKTVTDGATSSTKSLAGAQQASAAAVVGGSQAWDKYIAQLTQTRDLVGANAAQEAAYTAAKSGFNKQQVEYARLIGGQTDLLKKYEEAVKEGKKTDQDRLSAQLLVSIKSSELLKTQLELHEKTMSKMAKATEDSVGRQLLAYGKIAANSVWSSINGGKTPLQFPFVGPQDQAVKPRTGASLLTFGQAAPKTNGKTPEQLRNELLDQVTGNTDTKSPKGEKGLSSKLSAAKTAFDELYKAAQPAKFALQEYVERQSQLELLLSKGKITQQLYNEALAQSSLSYAAAIKGAQGLAPAEQYRAQLERQLATQRMEYAAQADAVGMGQKDASRMQERLRIEQDTNNRILQLQTELANAQGEKQRQDLQAQIDLEREYLGKRVAVQREGWAQLDQAQSSWSAGARGAFQDYLDSARDVAGQSRAFFTNAFSSMEDAVANFAISGKLSFSDFTKSILADMARIATRQAATGIFASIAGSAIGGWFGGGANGLASGSAGEVSSKLGASAAGYSTKFGFSSGGYTGDGGKFEPKGVVHGGEYVVRKEVVSQPGMRDHLDRLNKKGYASGGYVSSAPGGQGQAPSVTINMPMSISVRDRSDEGMQLDQQALQQNLQAQQAQMRAIAEDAIARSWRPGGTSFRQKSGRA